MQFQSGAGATHSQNVRSTGREGQTWLGYQDGRFGRGYQDGRFGRGYRDFRDEFLFLFQALFENTKYNHKKKNTTAAVGPSIFYCNSRKMFFFSKTCRRPFGWRHWFYHSGSMQENIQRCPCTSQEQIS